MPAPDVDVSVGLDQASIDQLTKAIEGAVTAGAKTGAVHLGDAITKAFKTASTKASKESEAAWSKLFNKTNKQAGTAGSKDGATYARAYTESMKKLEAASRAMSGALSRIFQQDLSNLKAEVLQVQRDFRNVGRVADPENNVQASRNYRIDRDSLSRQTNVAQEQVSVALRAAGIKQAEQIKANGKLAAIAEANTGRLQGIEARKNADILVRQARTAGETRVAVVKGVVKGLVLAEKAAGAAIAGIARTTTSVLSKTASGLGKIGSTISGIFRRSNSDLTDGLSGALSKRERQMRNAFSSEEQALRGSVSRQSRQLVALREQQQRGLTGAITRRGLGGLLGGIGVAAIARSTFTVGADYVRGLAVLQEQLSLTEDQMKGVDRLSIQLGNDITLPGVSALDAAQAIQILTKQFGYLGPAAITAAEAAAKGTLQLSRATGSSAEDAAGIIGAAVNVFKIGADEAISVADSVAVALSKAAGTSFTEFSDAFKQGASVFQEFVGPAETAKQVIAEFNTGLAILARNGIVGESAGAGLKQFFISGTKTGKAATQVTNEIVARAGVSGKIFFDANKNARTFGESIDVLRKGTAGLSDQERTRALTVLFGSRAQTIANALIGTSAEEFNALRDSMERTGAAAAIAAAQNTGLKGALDALQSVAETVQIVFYKKVSPALAGFVLAIADLTNKLLFSDGAWVILRRGLLGAAVGLGAVLAAKGAVEVFGLLAKTLPLLLTPFGAVIALAAVLGAAIAIATGPVNSFSDAINAVLDPIQKLVAGWLGLKDVLVVDDMDRASTRVASWGEILGRVRDIITGSVLPAVGRFIVMVGGVLVQAFKVSVAFVRAEVIPVLERIASVIRTKVLVAFDFLAAKAKAVWHVVEPFLLPLIHGFGALGTAVAAAFNSGSFAGIGSALGGAASGVATTAGLIGTRILEVLRPIGAKVVAWFANLFSPANLSAAISAVSDFVFTVGKILGSIVSDPRFLTAIAVIAAIAVKIALEFVTGFAQGIINNLPKIMALISTVLSAALTAAFKAAIGNLGVVILAAFAALTFGPALFRMFNKNGQQAGDGFTTGFMRNTRNAITGMVRGTSGFQSIYKEAGLRAGSAFVQGFRKNNALLATAGQPTISSSGFFVTPQQAARAEEAVARVRARLGEAGFAALEARTKMASMWTVLKGIGTTLTAGVKGQFKDDFLGLKASGQSTFTALKKTFRFSLAEMKAIAAKEGITIGQALGIAVQGAASAALAVVGGFVAGKAEGKAGGSGVTSALLSGLTATALTGNVALGGLAVAASLVGTAVGKSAKKAEDAKARFQGVTDVLKNNLSPALLAAATDAQALVASLDSQTSKDLFDTLDDSTVATLDKMGISAELLRATFAKGADAVDALRDHIRRGADGSEEAGDAIRILYRDSIRSLDAIRTRQHWFAKSNAIVFESIAAQGKYVADGMFRAGFDIDQVNTKLAALGIAYRVTPADLKAPQVAAAKAAVAEVAAGYDELLRKRIETDNRLDDPIPLPGTTSLTKIINDAVIGVDNLGETITQAQQDAAAGININVNQAVIATNLDAFSTTVQTAVTEGLNSGAAITPEQARLATKPILDAALDGAQSPAARQAILDTWETTFGLLGPTFDRALASLGQGNLDSGVAGRTKALFVPVGKAIDEGIAKGVDQYKNLPLNQIERLVNSVKHVATSMFKISSPSKVFIGIGQFVSEGLAIGIADGATSAGQAAQQAVEAAITKATESADKGKATIAAAAASLFGSLTGSQAINLGGGTVGAISAAQGGITSALQGIRAAADSSWAAQLDIWNTVASGGTLSHTQKDVLGEDWRSLNTQDVLGVSNLNAVTSALDSIAGLGEKMLAQGTPVAQVTASLTGYVSQLLALTDSIGFSHEQVLALADAFGLSQAALAAFLAETQKIVALPSSSGQFVGDSLSLPVTRIVNNTFNNSLSFPYGDPQAIALGVANGQARAARIPA